MVTTRTLIFIAIIIIVSCSPKTRPGGQVQDKPTETNAPAKDFQKENYTKATVIDMTGLDGCGFMLQLENGKKLEPDKPIEEAFKVDGLPVWVKFQTTKGIASICMAGQMVRISHIEKR